MKRLLSITALALVIALSLAFTGCSGAQKDASANFQGSWKMTNVAGATEDDIAAMEAFGISVVLDLNEDKTAWARKYRALGKQRAVPSSR